MYGFRLFVVVLSIPCAIATWWLLHAAGVDEPIWHMAAIWMMVVGLLLGIDWYMERQIPTPTAAQLSLLSRWFDAQRAGDRGEEKRLAELVAAEQPNYR
jgi:hypothetical protein